MSTNENTNDEYLDDELVELEFDEESVSYYIVDENDNEIGVCLIEDGEEVEYMYEDVELQSDANFNALHKEQMINGIKNVKGELEDFKDDALDIAAELKSTTDELQSILGEVKDSLKIFPKKK